MASSAKAGGSGAQADLSTAAPAVASPESFVAKDRMQVAVIKIHAGPLTTLRSPYVVLTMNNRVYRTSVSRQATGEWNESFLFECSFHTQLFGTLQLDLYDSGFWGDAHVGRAEIKLILLTGFPPEFTSWYELWRKEDAYAMTSEVRRRGLVSNNVGAVQLRIRHGFGHKDGLDETLLKAVTSLKVEEGQPLLPEDLFYTSMLNSPVDSSNQPIGAEASSPLLPRSGQEPKSSSIASLEAIHTRNPHKSSAEDLAKEEQHLAQSLEFLSHEDDTLPTEASTLTDRVSNWFLSQETNQVLRSIRKLLAEFGQGLDFSNADLLNGILTLEKFYVNYETPKTGKVVQDLSKIEKPLHFYKFAMASYGWKGLNFFGRGAGYIKGILFICGKSATRGTSVCVDATRRDADRKGLLEFLAMPERNLLQFELLTVEIFRPSYFIAVDEHTDAIVLTVRGTMSATDTLTDLVCEYVKWNDGVVHEGVLASAQWFIDNVLNDLIAYVYDHDKPNLILCGHSLGGGVSSVLGMLMTENMFRFRRKDGGPVRLHVYSFAPPPVVSLNLARRYKQFIDSFVVEDDIVCRLSYGHMQDLKTMLVAAIETSQRPSFFESLWTNMTKPATGIFSDAPLNHLALCREGLRSQQDPRQMNIKLYMAGTVYYLYYADPNQRPFASLMPAYRNVDIQKLRSNPTLATKPPAPQSPDPTNVVLTTSPPTLDNPSTIAPVSLPLQPTTSTMTPPTNPSTSPAKNNNNCKFKRVVMEQSDPVNFTEIILKRTVFLEHIPNTYDKAFHRAFETLMLDLRNNMSTT